MRDEDIVKRIEQKKYIESLRRKYPKDEELIELVESDLDAGLSISLVSKYVNEKLTYGQRKVFSFCLRRKYSDDIIQSFVHMNLAHDKAEIIMDYYEKGLSLEFLGLVGANITDVSAMKSILEQVVQFKQSVSNTTDSKIEEIQDLLNDILEKSEQQQSRLKELLDEKFEYFQGERDGLLRNLSDKDKLIQMQSEKVKQLSVKLQDLEVQIEKERQEYTKPNSQRLFMHRQRKLRTAIIRKAVEHKLSAEQIAEIRIALEKGMSEKQMLYMMEPDIGVEQMKEMITLAFLKRDSQKRLKKAARSRKHE